MPRRSLVALLVSGACVLALSVLWVATFVVGFTSWLDRGVQSGFVALRDTSARAPAELAVHSVDPLPFALCGLALIAVAGLRRRFDLAVGTGVILLGANVTTQILQHLTAAPRAYEVLPSSVVGGELWPSGHTTAVVTLVLCLVLVSPPRLRPTAAALGALFAVGVVYSILLIGWHLPSDVIGGFLVSGAWTFLVLAARWELARRGPMPVAAARVPVPLTAVFAPALLAFGAGVALTALVTVAEFERVRDHAVAHTAFVLGAPLIGAAALALTAGVAFALRR